MNSNTLKISSAISAFCVCFPGETLTMPLGGNILLLFETSDIRLLILPIATITSFTYLIVSAAQRYKGLSDRIITLVILLTFLVYIFNHACWFLDYGNWLSSITVLVAVVMAGWTIGVMGRSVFKQIKGA